MPKGYWIANNIVHDPETYERYKAANGPVFARYNARFVVRGGQQKGVEGEVFPRTVLIEFPSYEAALAAYNDPEYQEVADIRRRCAESTIIIVEGYDG